MSDNINPDDEGIGQEEGSAPDFSDPRSVVVWYGKQIMFYLHLMRREKAGTRLRALNSAIDSWSKAVRLSADTAELTALRAELEELKAQLIEDGRLKIA